MEIRFPTKSLILAILSVGLIGCVSKGITKPRSEIVSEAQSSGVPIKTVEEDREAFYGIEKAQEERLIDLLKKRATGEFKDTSYRIGVADEVELNVFDVPELNVTAKVRPSGFLSLPLVGAVQAAGRTEAELHDELTKRLSSFVRNPQVNVFMSHYGSQKVAVMGAVRKPGTYSLKKGSNSVLELIGAAGGLTEKAGNFMNFIPAELSGITAENDVEARARLALAADEVSRSGDRGIEIYLDQVMGTTGGIPLEVPVRGGDMIVVPEAGKIMVEGEVEKVGTYELGQQMSLLSALAAAGGITYGAKVDEIEIIRDAGGGNKAHLVLDLQKLATGEGKDVRLRNGDIVKIPSDSGRRMTQDTFEGIAKIVNFGIGGTVPLR